MGWEAGPSSRDKHGKTTAGTADALPPTPQNFRRTWLEAVLATGPEKKGELSPNWKLGVLGHLKVITGLRVKAESGQSREKEEEALVCGRSQTIWRLFLAMIKSPALGTPSTPRECWGGEDGRDLGGPPQRKSCLALEERYGSSHPHIDLPPSTSASLLCHFFQRRQEPDQQPRPEPQELGPLNGDTGE